MTKDEFIKEAMGLFGMEVTESAKSVYDATREAAKASFVPLNWLIDNLVSLRDKVGGEVPVAVADMDTGDGCILKGISLAKTSFTPMLPDKSVWLLTVKVPTADSMEDAIRGAYNWEGTINLPSGSRRVICKMGEFGPTPIHDTLTLLVSHMLASRYGGNIDLEDGLVYFVKQ